MTLNRLTVDSRADENSIQADRSQGGVPAANVRGRASRRARAWVRSSPNIANQWDGLLVFLDDGRVEMDSNFVENPIRPIKLTAKNALFSGQGPYGSLIETCKMKGVEPYAWLKTTLEKIAAGQLYSSVDELLPCIFKPPSS